MTTYTAITKHERRDIAEALAEAVENHEPKPMGIACLEIEDGSGWFEVAAYYEEKPNEVELMILAAVYDVSPFVISKLDDRDWVAQVRRELTPVRAGRFLVYGKHDQELVKSNDIGLEIEAAMAFGTGHHGTTLGCLLLTERLYKARFMPSKIADIGTGTGILAMAAARRFPKARIIASDIETISVATARRNCDINKARSVRIIKAKGFQTILHRKTAPYDLVYANILSKPLRRMAGDMALNTYKGGYIILSGILNYQANAVISTFGNNGFHLETTEPIGEWVSFLFRKK